MNGPYKEMAVLWQKKVFGTLISILKFSRLVNRNYSGLFFYKYTVFFDKVYRMKLSGPLLTPYNEFINICSLEIESIWSFSLDADRRYIWTKEYIGVLPGTFST